MQGRLRLLIVGLNCKDGIIDRQQRLLIIDEQVQQVALIPCREFTYLNFALLQLLQSLQSRFKFNRLRARYNPTTVCDSFR